MTKHVSHASPAVRRGSIAVLLLALACALAQNPAVASAQSPPAPSLGLDTAFSPPSGIARDGTSNTSDTAGGVAVDGDRIYTVGESNGDVAIIARTPNGALDPGFAGDGRLDLPIGQGKDAGVAVAVLPDHRLRVLASTDSDPSASATNIDVALIGLNADGTDDSSFGGGDGRVSFPVGARDDTPTRMAVDATGRLAIAGWTKDAAGEEDSFVSLREADGSAASELGPAATPIRPPYSSVGISTSP